QIQEQLEVFSPKELIFPNSLAPLLIRPSGSLSPSASKASDQENSTPANSSLSDSRAYAPTDTALTSLDDWIFGFDHADSLLRSQLGVSSLDGFGLVDRRYAVCAAGAAVHYVNETQKAQASHLSEIAYFEINDYLALDAPTVSNLELVVAQDGKPSLSLF